MPEFALKQESSMQPEPELSAAIRWPVPTTNLTLDRDDVHVWAASLDAGPATLTELRATLSAPELARADRFHFPLHQARFIAGRGLLRLLLSRYLQTEPQIVEFVYGSQGKPALSPVFAKTQLHFNLAHSEGLALFAVSRLAPLGVDVERVRPLAEAEDLVARFFSPRESRLFQNLPGDQQPAAFFNLWTRKEAWLKATGQGIGHGLNLVEVSFVPGEPAQLLELPPKMNPAASWSLHDLTPAPAFAAALAVAAPTARLDCRRLMPNSPISNE